jgi:hypothetical protein
VDGGSRVRRPSPRAHHACSTRSAGGSTLGNEAALLHARTLVADNGAERQRYVAGEQGAGRAGLRALVDWLARETSDSADEILDRRV